VIAEDSGNYSLNYSSSSVFKGAYCNDTAMRYKIPSSMSFHTVHLVICVTMVTGLFLDIIIFSEGLAKT